MDAGAGWQTKDVVVVASSLASLVGVPWLTHIFSRRRIGPDKVWNLKLEAYNQIIQAVVEASGSFRKAQSILETAPKRAIDCLDTEPGADQEIAKGIDRLDRMFDLMNGNQLICSKMVSITGLVIYSECGVKRYAVTLEDIKVISQEMSWGCEKLKSLCKEELGLVDRNPRRTRTPFLLFMLREWIANMLGRRREEGSS
jgi:hypothetical protein